MTEDLTGREFEERALHMAQAIHDPLGLQGAHMFEGVEHDGLFLIEEQVHAYEFTTSPKKDKAKGDADKIARLLKAVLKSPQGRYRTPTGWFVTQNEPTADQRQAVAEVAKREALTIHCISFRALQGRICDGEGYLRCRDSHPFGSTSIRTSISDGQNQLPEIPIELSAPDETRMDLNGLAERLSAGRRLVLTGQFGVGKSHTLRETYRLLRKRYLRNDSESPLPIHINLRECVGLTRPSEVLRRHAEEIGFVGDRQLVSAWRSGRCVLLLDGFDEVASTRRVGSLSDLRSIRWESMSALRGLVEQAPPESGVLMAGRSHYFSSESEMLESLGFTSSDVVLTANDLTREQVERALKPLNGAGLPDWIPTRPLLLGYLISLGLLRDLSEGEVLPESTGWRRLLRLIAEREARMVSGVSPDTILDLIVAVAIEARGGGSLVGPVSMAQLEAAFYAVAGRRAVEDDLQVLLRLPGLAVDDTTRGTDARVFVDRALASTAYGEALARYVMNPYGSSPLGARVPWVETSDELAVAVSIDALKVAGITAGQVRAVCKGRDEAGNSDAVLADCLGVLAGQEPGSLDRRLTVDGVIIEELNPGESVEVWSQVTFNDCLLATVDLGGLHSSADSPTFTSCAIGLVRGATQWPESLGSNLVNTDVAAFDLAATTDSILSAGLEPDVTVAVTVLKKVYRQRGSGRKESALSRGLSPDLRGRVPAVLQRMCSGGWLSKHSSGNSTVYVRSPERQAEAAQILDQPDRFVW